MRDTDDAAPSTSTRFARRWSWVVLAATALVFGPGTLGGFVWDDRLFIKASRGVQEPRHLVTLFNTGFWDVSMTLGPRVEARYYRPLVAVVYAVQLQVFRADAAWFHRVSLGLHLACVLLAMRWVRRRLVRAGYDGVRAAAGAMLAGGAFALHPTRPESVSWISGSTDLWAALWCLLALEEWDRGPTPRRAALTAGLMLLALLSKESALVIPALLLVDAWADDTWRQPALRRAWAVVTAPMVAAWLVRVAWFPLRDPMSLHEPLSTAAARVLASVGHLARLAAWPWPLSVLPAPARFDAAGSVLYAPWAVALGAAVTLAFAALTWAAATRRPAWRGACADVAWFVVALAPVANVIPLRLYTLVAPRFLYLPMLGLAALFGRAVAAALTRRPDARPLVLASSAAALLACGLASIEHAEHFRSNEELWEHEISVHPDDPVALSQLSRLRGRRDYAQGLALAFRAYRGALAHGATDTAAEMSLLVAARVADMTPDAEQDELLRVRRFYDGFTPDARGDAVLDVPRARLSVRLTPEARALRSPLEWRVPRALAYARTQRLDEALRQLESVVRDTPQDPSAWRALVDVLARLERWDDALGACARFARSNVADFLTRRYCEALPATRDAALHPPDDPVLAALRRADRLAGIGAYEQARRVLEPVLREHSPRVDVEEFLAHLEVRERQYGRALQHLRAVQSLRPDADIAREIARVEGMQRDPPR